MAAPQQNQDTVAQHVQRLNQGDVSGYMRMYHPDCVFHGYPPEVPPDHAGITQFYTALVAGFPDARVSAEDIVADGDRVAVRYVLTGTHTGGFLAAPPTGAAVRVDGLTILRFADGQVVERWNRLDDLALLTAIGALPQQDVDEPV